jgi:hypothetical protein
MVSLPTRISFRGYDLAARVVQARGVDGIACGVDSIGQATTSFANGADGILRAV